MSRNKYNARKVTVNGETFDSQKEYKRFCELSLLQRAGKIADLRRQVKFVLIPAQREPDRIGKRGGIIKGKLLEQECAYYADFVYRDVLTGVTVVEDTKGMRTDVYKIKRKLMLKEYGIRIREV